VNATKTLELICDAIIFDLDGVLVDSAAVVERHWRRWAERRGVEYVRVSAVMHGRRSAETIAIVAPSLDADAEAREMEAGEAIDTNGLRVLDGASALLNSLPAERWGIATSGTITTHAAVAVATAALIVPGIASLDVRQQREGLTITAPSV